MRRTLPALLLVLLVALVARMEDYPAVFGGERVLPVDVDSFYHGRRIVQAARDWPRVAVEDGFVEHANGARIVWPAGYDLLHATVARALGGADASRDFILGVASVGVAVLGALTAAAAFFLGRYLFGPGAGLWAGLALALMPAHRMVSGVGNLDHHVIEPLLSTLAYFALLAATRAEGKAAGRLGAVGAGALLALSFYFWTGFLMYLAPPLLWIGLRQAGAYLAGRTEARFDARVATAFAAGTIFMIPVVRTSPWGRDGTFEYYVLSNFHLAAMAGVFALVCVLPLLARAADRLRLSRPTALAGAVALILASLGLAAAASPGVRATLGLAFEFLGGGGTAILSAGESLGLFHGGARTAARYLTPALFLLPLLALYVYAMRREVGDGARAWLFLACWFGIIGALAVTQRRFTPAFSVPMALLLGLAADVGLRAARRRPAHALVPVAIVACLAPAVAEMRLRRAPGGLPQFALFKPTLDWLRESTPPGGDLAAPENPPLYTVFSDWGMGHWLILIGERPAAATPFGMAPWHDQAKRDAFRILSARDEAEAYKLLAEKRARYYIATPMHPYATMLQRIWDGEAAAGRMPPGDVAKTYDAWLNTRLLLGDPGEPRDAGGLPSVAHFRLLRESPERFRYRSERLGWDFTAPYARVYEAVPGAALTGACEPGEAVRASVSLRSNLGRDLLWESAEAACPDGGSFRVTVPYATEPDAAPPGGAAPAGPARLRVGARAYDVAIPEAAVREGAEVAVP